MVELKTQYPYVDSEKNAKPNLIKHYAEDENGNRYYIKKIGTNFKYTEAIDVYPCQYSYALTDEKIEVKEKR